jgi:hypothetical protein
MKVQIPGKCSVSHKGQLIVCAQKGRKIAFLNPGKRQVFRHEIDECEELRPLLKNPDCKLCDYLVCTWKNEQHFVELKGSNVEHALKQLESTIEQIADAPHGKLFCWIVTTESPRGHSKSQVLIEKFKRKHSARLKIRTNQCEHALEKQV